MAHKLNVAATSPWSWMGITCVMLALSGGVRFWRGMEFSERSEETRESPFPLAELPRVLGPWVLNEGSDAQLDPEIARIAGSSDHIVRYYTNGKTGQTVSVLIVYGLAANVSFHTADVCYPSAGYAPAESGPMTDYEMKIPGSGKVARYRGGFFTRRLGGATEYSEVVYSFRHAGAWVPNAAILWKSFRIHPGVFKVQIGRPVTELDIENGASKAMLGEFMREIENRLAQIADAKAAKAKAKGAEGNAAKK
jgi:hypothetical protein